MAIVETHSPDTFEGMVSGSDAWGLVGGKPSKWQVASFLILDVAPLFTPFAVISGIRRASYIRKLIQAERASDKARGVAAVDKALDMPIRTGLILAGAGLGAQTAPGSPTWVMMRMGRDVGTVVVIQYMDREGKIQSFLPSEDLLSEYFESRGDQNVVLPAVRRSGSFFDKDGISRLASIKRPRTPLPKWSPTTRGRRESPRKSSLSVHRARSAPSRRAKQISPWCPVHKRRHWCSVTRGKN